MNTMEISEIKENIYPISLDLYHQMLELDHLLEKTELFKGVIVKKMTKSTEHNYYVDILFELLEDLKPFNTIIRSEKTLSVGGSELEPDISIVEGTLKNYLKVHPKTAILVVEVSLSSLAYDRLKASIYASANIQTYWLLDGNNKILEVYSEPQNGEYQKLVIYSENDIVPVFKKNIDLTKVFSE